MAPEQALGLTVGPAADVYALGAIVYECLTGRPPFRAATVLETLDQVRSQEPVPPGRLQPGLPRDLQTICLKCLAKEPARRYASARELADDLGRWRRGEPIHARPASALARLGKWARRQPALAGLLAVSVLSLAALVAGVLVHQSRLQEEVRRTAAREAETRRQYRQAKDTLTRMLGRLEHRQLADTPRLLELQRDLIEDALAFYQGALEDRETPDPAVKLDAVRATRQAADLQQLLGRTDDAFASYRRALALLEGLPESLRDTSESQHHLRGCFYNLAFLQGKAGHPEEEERCLRVAVDISERMARVYPEDDNWQIVLAESLNGLGATYQQRGRPAEAEATFIRTKDLLSGLVRDHPGKERYQVLLSLTLTNLGLIYQTTNRLAQGAQVYEKAAALLAPLVERHLEWYEDGLSLASLYSNWGMLLAGTGRLPVALARHNQAVELAEALLQKEPKSPDARRTAANAHGARSQTFEALRRFADAARDYDKVVELADPSNRWVPRAIRARHLARAGEHVRAMAEVKDLLKEPEISVGGFTDMARIAALAAEAARKDAQLPESERAALGESYGAEAVALLRKLKVKGSLAGLRDAFDLRTDWALKTLANRADFQKLLAEVVGGK
jgi:tetratricopeptide (TPR) repeat protein